MKGPIQLLTAIMIMLAVLCAPSCKKETTNDPCAGITCVNGELVEDGNTCSCECEAGWNGTSCNEQDPCITNNVTCLNGGTCTDGTCNCPAGYTGADCSEHSPCTGVSCQNGGTCVNGACDCPPNYSGANCEIDDLCVNLNINCSNNGVCVSGRCNCPSGVIGEYCDTILRNYFIGYWDVPDTCNLSGNTIYTVTISASNSALGDVKLSNVWNYFINDVEGYILGDSLTIPFQQPDNDGVSIEGLGVIDMQLTDTLMYFQYTVTDPNNAGQTDICSATWNKY